VDDRIVADRNIARPDMRNLLEQGILVQAFDVVLVLLDL
jgi:hypothetical protein